MARLPDSTDLGTASASPGRPIVGYDSGIMGRALEQTGQGITKTAEDVQTKVNKVQFAYAQSNMLNKLSEAADKYKDDPDYKTIQDRFKKDVKDIAAESSGMITNPAARQMFQAETLQHVGRYSDHIRDLVDTKRKDYIRGSTLENIDRLSQQASKNPALWDASLTAINDQLVAAEAAGAITYEQRIEKGREYATNLATIRAENLTPEDKARLFKPTIKESSRTDYSSLDTKLSPEQEKEFQIWKEKNAPKDSGQDYDLRGAFLEGFTPDEKTGHFPDKYKKPNHPTFSDQSKFAKDFPDLAGSWDGETYIPPKGKGFDHAMQIVRTNEGGYVPVDGASGAPAIYGINEKSWPNEYAEAKRLTDSEGKQAGQKYAEEFYKKNYWDKYNIDALPAETQAIVMDGVINHRTNFADKLVLAAKNGASPGELIQMRRAEYERLATTNPKDYGPSLKGWNNRLDKFGGLGEPTYPEFKGEMAFLNLVPVDKLNAMRNKAEAELSVKLREDITPIEEAAKLGLKVPRENIISVASRAASIGQEDAAKKLLKFADVQDATSTFAVQDMEHQAKTLQALKSGVESGNTEDVALYEAYSTVYKNKLETLKKDPWSFYSAHDIVKQPAPLDLNNPEAASQELSRRRVDAAAVNKLEAGKYQLPLLTSAETDQLKEVYEKGTPQQAAAAITTIGQSLNQSERRALAQVVAPKSPSLAVALSVDPKVATGILMGSRTKGEVPEAKVREKVSEELKGIVFDPEASEALHESIFNYYKKLSLDAGDAAKEVADSRLETAIESIVGEKVTINPARMSDYLPAIASQTSTVFSYKDETGQYVDDNRLEDILGGITDDRLKELNGSLPYTSDGGFVTAEEVLTKGQFRNFGDGIYTVHFPGLGGLIGKDGRPYTIDARKLEAIQKK